MGGIVSYSEQALKMSFAFGRSRSVSDAIRDDMGMYSEAMAWLKAKCDAESKASVMRQVGAAKATFYKAVGGTQDPSAANFLSWLETLGAKIVFPGDRPEIARDVCWVDAKVVPAGDGQCLPPAESYFAVPMVGEAGAGPGIMPEDEIKSWVLVYRHQHAIRFKKDLLAVEIAKDSTSMVPLLRPGDIVLVDREDRKPEKAGGIFLVREPGQEGGAMVKRVATKAVDGDLLITFYSENAAENPADTYNLRVDYDNDINKAVVGRCVWAWSDITGK
uniref:Putative transcriptional regulator n=1 Tax=Desulfovibrio sp. U5L TaxID=596152 RepID=I2Q054_9BACT